MSGGVKVAANWFRTDSSNGAHRRAQQIREGGCRMVWSLDGGKRWSPEWKPMGMGDTVA
jgi:hypothetical protein